MIDSFHIALLAAVAVCAALGVMALRLRQARAALAAERKTWKRQLDQELDQARAERDRLLDALDDAFLDLLVCQAK